MLDREDQPLFQDPKSWLKTSTIRDRLQLWETENQVLRSLESQFEPPPAEIALAEYQRQTTFDEEGLAHDSEYCPYPVYERGDIVDLESQRPYLLRGDMVELRYGYLNGLPDDSHLRFETNGFQTETQTLLS